MSEFRIRGDGYIDSDLTVVGQLNVGGHSVSPSFVTNGYNVKDYGALGNGTGNDAAAIQAAINAAGQGGVVLFPYGTYRTTNTIFPLVGQKLVTVSGIAAGATLQWAGAVDGYVLRVQEPEVTIEGLTFNGNNVATGIWAKGHDNWTIYGCTLSRCHFEQCTDGFRADVNDNNLAQNDTWSFYSCLWETCEDGVEINTGDSDFWGFYSCNFGSCTNSIHGVTGVGQSSFYQCIFGNSTTDIRIDVGAPYITWTLIGCQGESGSNMIHAAGAIRFNLIDCVINETLYFDNILELVTTGCQFNIIPPAIGIQTVNQKLNWTSRNDTFLDGYGVTLSIADWITQFTAGLGFALNALMTGHREFNVYAGAGGNISMESTDIEIQQVTPGTLKLGTIDSAVQIEGNSVVLLPRGSSNPAFFVGTGNGSSMYMTNGGTYDLSAVGDLRLLSTANIDIGNTTPTSIFIGTTGGTTTIGGNVNFTGNLNAIDPNIATVQFGVIGSNAPHLNYQKIIGTDPASTGDSNWYNWVGHFPNVGDANRQNFVNRWGWNVNAGGGLINAGQGALIDEWESYYNPDGRAGQLERHLVYVTPTGLVKRVFDFVGDQNAPYNTTAAVEADHGQLVDQSTGGNMLLWGSNGAGTNPFVRMQNRNNNKYVYIDDGFLQIKDYVSGTDINLNDTGSSMNLRATAFIALQTLGNGDISLITASNNWINLISGSNRVLVAKNGGDLDIGGGTGFVLNQASQIINIGTNSSSTNTINIGVSGNTTNIGGNVNFTGNVTSNLSVVGNVFAENMYAGSTLTPASGPGGAPYVGGVNFAIVQPWDVGNNAGAGGAGFISGGFAIFGNDDVGDATLKIGLTNSGSDSYGYNLTPIQITTTNADTVLTTTVTIDNATLLVNDIQNETGNISIHTKPATGVPAQNVLIYGGPSDTTHSGNVFIGVDNGSADGYIYISADAVFGGAAQVNIGFVDTPIWYEAITGERLGAVLTSSSTITPTNSVHQVSGTNTISTITPPTFFGEGALNVGIIRLTLIPTNTWATTTGGNIDRAVTAVTGIPMELIYVQADGKWYIHKY